MRSAVLLSFVLAFPVVADDVLRPVAIVGDLTLLSDAQKHWLASFESGARLNETPDAVATWLHQSASAARDAGLKATSDYLDTASRDINGSATIEELEKSWRGTLNEPLLVTIRIDAGKIVDLTICTCDQDRARRVDAAIEKFERGLPGFKPAWIDRSATRAQTRIAKLHFRAGRSAATVPTGTYLPFNRASTAAVGRTWIVYENSIRAGWWGESLRPIALRILPNAASKATAEAMIDWYGTRSPIYDAGPNLTPAELDRLGAAKDPLRIIKGDLLPVLLAGSSDESIATLTAVSFHTLSELARGEAPPQHGPAVRAEINYLIERGALHFDAASVTWQIDFARYRAAVRELANRELAIESAGDAAAAEALLAKYGAANPAIDKTVEVINAIPRVKLVPVYPTEG
jgi:hypothetical protein